VWPGDKLTGVKGRDQVASAMGIYGPRTTYVLALKDVPGTHEFLLLDEGLLSILSSNSKVLMEDIWHFFFFINWNLEAPLTLLAWCIRKMATCQGHNRNWRRKTLLPRKSESHI
jgi:hypothetical protein